MSVNYISIFPAALSPAPVQETQARNTVSIASADNRKVTRAWRALEGREDQDVSDSVSMVTPVHHWVRGVAETCLTKALTSDILPIFYLSMSVKKKIWKNEYIDLISLLPSAKEFNFKNDKKDSKSEEERRRPVTKSFKNWLQAFCIYASVMA